MRANTFRRAAVLLPVVVILVWAMRPAIGQSSISLQPKPGEWRTYGSDLASTHYSPLDQIIGRQLQQARSRVALQDRRAGPAARVQPGVNAARRQRRDVFDRRHAPRRWSRSTR